MQITVTNTSQPLVALLSASDNALAVKNKSGASEFKVTLYNADSTSTDIVYYSYGENATVAEGLPILAPSSAITTGDSYTVSTGDLTKINLISNVAATTVNVLIEPNYVR
jgi:hypothetical protein